MKDFGPLIKRSLVSIFALDVRSLALLRVMFGAYLVYDLAFTFSRINIYWTDSGTISNSLSQFITSDLGFWTPLHYFSSFGVYAFFCFFFLAAFALLLGYFTQIAAFSCWLCLVFVSNRNLFYWYPGDDILRNLLFWAAFLPMGATFSVDSTTLKGSKLEKKSTQHLQTQIANLATAAFTLRLVLFLFLLGMHKTAPSWHDGSAVRYMLVKSWYATPASRYFLLLPGLSEVLTYGSLIIEIYGPLLFLVPWRNWIFRMIGGGLIIGLLLGIRLCVDNYGMSWIFTAAFLGLMPPQLWNRTKRMQKLPQVSWQTSFHNLPVWPRRISISILSFLFVCATYIEITKLHGDGYFRNPLPKPSLILKVSEKMRFYFPFRLFVDPAGDGPFQLILEGVNRQGQAFDLFTGKPGVKLEIPPYRDSSQPDFRWSRFLLHTTYSHLNYAYPSPLNDQKTEQVKRSIARFVCRKWEGLDLQRVTLKSLEQDNFFDDHPTPIKQVTVWTYLCAKSTD